MIAYKKGQIPFPPQAIPIAIVIFLLLILLPVVSDVFNSIGCQKEKNQINDLQGKLSSCQSSNMELKGSLENCLYRLDESNETCQNIIENLSNEYEIRLQKNKIVLHFQNRFRIFLFILIIPLSLLSISIKPKLKEKHERVLFIIKSLIWIAYFVILTVAYRDFFRTFFGF